MVELEKGFQYEMCAHFKLNNVRNGSEEGLLFLIQSVNKTEGIFEKFISKLYFGTLDWRIGCHITGVIQRKNGNSEKYYFGLYTGPQRETVGEVFVDDVSVRRVNFRITISNDRDEVYDKVNVVYQINGHKDNYNLSDFELITKIKDNNNKIYYNKKTDITSFLFTKKISVDKLGLVNNNFYQVEGTLKNKKDNVTDTFSYTFKKINKIKRNVTIDEYGRMYVNGELFFPFGSYLITVKQSDLALLNKTHLNFIMPYWEIDKKNYGYDLYNTKRKNKSNISYTKIV